MKEVLDLPKFVRQVFYEHDISKLNLDLNKTHIMLLMVIHDHEERSMSAISRDVGLDKSSITRSVDSLVQRNYITRVPSQEDRRVIHLVLTKKGQHAVGLIRKDWERHFQSIMDIFSQDERQEFCNAIKTISKYINRISTGENT